MRSQEACRLVADVPNAKREKHIRERPLLALPNPVHQVLSGLLLHLGKRHQAVRGQVVDLGYVVHQAGLEEHVCHALAQTFDVHSTA